MGLFGKKKTPEETVAEGRAQFESGDFKKAFLTLHGLANKGEPEASYYIGLYWLREKHDKGMAKKYLTTAAKAHVRDAAQLLAAEYGTRDDLPKDAVPQPAPEPAPKAEAPAQKSAPQPKPAPKAAPKAEAPDQEAQAVFQSGMRSYMAKDYAKALSFFQQAAEQGHAKAQFNCGVMYDNGEGTAADKAKALYWYEKAAELGHAQAQFNCGRLYSKGEGTAVDKGKALYWFEKAAEQGQADAQFICGGMYFAGEGTARDKARAKQWIQKAASQTENQNAQEAAANFLWKFF